MLVAKTLRHVKSYSDHRQLEQTVPQPHRSASLEIRATNTLAHDGMPCRTNSQREMMMQKSIYPLPIAHCLLEGVFNASPSRGNEDTTVITVV